MKTKRRATRKASSARTANGKSVTIEVPTGHLGLQGGRPKVKTRTSIAGLKIYPPAEPPRIIPREAFSDVFG